MTLMIVVRLVVANYCDVLRPSGHSRHIEKALLIVNLSNVKLGA